ncbi:MAG TPA: hypothetical protein VFS91_10410 [Nitrobacter sp.]|nr:hypothetical protein [Nitrobacter sp.]
MSPRLRIFLYAAAGIIFTLWISLELFGGAGFVAFAIGMIGAQLTFRWRPSLNVAFIVFLIAYAATLLVWSAAIGPPRPSNLHATQTAAAADS